MADDNSSYELVRNTKGKSDVWAHFSLKRKRQSGEIIDNVAVCDRCHTSVKCGGGTTNLSTHLARHHKITKLTARSSVVKPSQCTFADPSKSKGSQPMFAHPSQPTVMHMFNASSPQATASRSAIITDKIARFIIRDLRPFSVVCNEGFKDLITTLDPRYKMPSRPYFSQTVIPDMYDREKLVVLDSLRGASSVALTMDGWTSKATESYMTITSSHITDDWQLKNFVLQTRTLPVSHTGENIANEIRSAILEWNLPQHPALVTDNAANMLVAGKEALCYPHLGCYAHTLNLAVQKALKINSIARLLGRIRRIVSFFHRSTTASAVYREKLKLLGLRQVKLIQDVSTRWNSAVDMLERFLEVQPAVYAVLMSKDIRTKESDIATLNEEDISLAEEVMVVLVPLRTITTALCTESMPTASEIVPLQKKLLTKILIPHEGNSVMVEQLKRIIREDLTPRYSNVGEFLSEATLLDPRFKTACFDDDEKADVIARVPRKAAISVKVEPTDQTAGQELNTLPLSDDAEPQLPKLPDDVVDAVPLPSTGLAAIFDDVVVVKQEPAKLSKTDLAIQELSAYLEVPNISMQADPLVWWKENSWNFPILAALAKTVLCVPATSVPSERVFSTAGDILSAQRSALDSENVDRLIFLKKNMS